MALLQNEEFLIWQLRTSYLSHIKDGIGERLITVDNAILNDPSFRAAGWSNQNGEAKQAYSPPIPTAISSDYFAAPPRLTGLDAGPNEEEDEGGMVTGRGSADTLGPSTQARRRKRKEQFDEDDSSDLSDESEDDIESSKRAAQQIRFAKMPVRTRSGSSPIRSSQGRQGVEVNVISPSRRSTEGRLRSGSLTGIEAIKQRARRDTTTSSEFSSENEFDQSHTRRRPINPAKAAKAGDLLFKKHEEDERNLQARAMSKTIHEDSEGQSDGTDLSSEFGETADSESLLDDIAGSSLGDMPPPLNFGTSESPKKVAKILGTITLQALPPPRPISTIIPISLLGQALRAKKATPKNPVEVFARLSGKGVPDPLHIRIYAPFSDKPEKAIEMPLLRTVQDNESGEKPQVTVADAIGLSLWRYEEEKFMPAIEVSRLNVNRWTLRMIEDGEVDYDFPALSRTRPIMDFTSNNNRGARGRSRGKPYDDFALVEATDVQFKENQALTPKYEQYAATTEPAEDSPVKETKQDTGYADGFEAGQISGPVRRNPIIHADKPQLSYAQSTPRVGPPKDIKIHFTSLEAISQMTTIKVTTDTYLAEVLDQVCKRWVLDKAYHILKVRGSNTIAPVDRTVEALGNIAELDLLRRRFANDGAMGLAGSPGSSSPNAPLLLDEDSPKKGTARRMQTPITHPFSRDRTRDFFSQGFNPSSTTSIARHKRFNVIRKQPMSFAPSQPRILLMDEDFVHILPPDTGGSKTLFDHGAVNPTKAVRRVAYSMIVGCKVSRRHPKLLRVVVAREDSQREGEQKRYDFEAQTALEAAEIVEEIGRRIEAYGTGLTTG